jgi:hypothetical protein
VPIEVDAFIHFELPAVSENWAVFSDWITLKEGILQDLGLITAVS